MKYNWKFMFKRKISKSDKAVVGIVVAILLIGLIVSVLSVIQTQYIPKWMKEKEAEHMDEVANQFADIKFAIDTQTFFKERNALLTNSITLGCSELPFFISTRSYGQLDIIDDISTITIFGNINGVDQGISFEEIGVIKYSSVNGYLEDQTFIYESGAVITSQSEGNFMSIDPSFKPNWSDPYFNISFKIVDVQSKGGKYSETGYDTTSLRTDFTSSVSETIYDVQYITIETNYVNSWKEFFRYSLKEIGLDESTNEEIKDFRVIEEIPGQVKVIFEIDGKYDFPYVKYEKFIIEAQIGAGIVN